MIPLYLSSLTKLSDFLQSTHIYFLFVSLLYHFIHCSCSVKCAFISSRYPLLINPFPVSRLISLGLFEATI